MRCFVGIPLPAETRRALCCVGDAIRRADAGWRAEKWVAENNLHVTVAFLGEVAEESGSALADAIELEVQGVAAFDLPFGRLSAVPNERHARMLWARYQDPEGACAGLAAGVARACAPLGIALEDRPFRAHVTLARARRTRTLLREGVVAAQAAANAIPAIMSVRSATLFSSTLTKAGPRYESLRSWRFPG
jgi:2'-5' RNA ligase